jgi:hypothetical protein
MTTKLRLDTTALKVQRGIRQAEDELVKAIQEALNNKSSYGDLEESQFRNLVRVSDSTESTEVIKNFLRYQVGRDNKWGRGEKSLATKIISDIDVKIKKIAEEDIAKKITEEQKFNDPNSETVDFKPIHLELVRRYLGYGARHLKYLRDGK